jgi:hypothetical protein
MCFTYVTPSIRDYVTCGDVYVTYDEIALCDRHETTVQQKISSLSMMLSIDGRQQMLE